MGAGAMPPFGGPGIPGACPTIAALKALFPGFGSTSFSADFVAVLLMVPVPVTVANKVRVLDDPLGSDPIVQRPVMLSYVPVLGLAETKVRPAGSKSVTWTPVASEGPALMAVTVYVTGEPTMTVGLLAVLVTPTSAREVTVVGSLAESLARLSSPPPATVASFVTDPG